MSACGLKCAFVVIELKVLLLNHISIASGSGTRGRVKKAVSHVVDLDPSNFDAVVLDSKKDVLVEFYAPCKARFLFSGLSMLLASLLYNILQ